MRLLLSSPQPMNFLPSFRFPFQNAVPRFIAAALKHAIGDYLENRALDWEQVKPKGWPNLEVSLERLDLNVEVRWFECVVQIDAAPENWNNV